MYGHFLLYHDFHVLLFILYPFFSGWMDGCMDNGSMHVSMHIGM